MEHLRIGYIIVVSPSTPAVDTDAEELFCSDAPLVEGALRQLYPLAQIGVEPLALDLLQGDFPSPLDGLNEPNILVH